MKRILTLFMMSCLIAVVFAGCGSSNSTETADTGKSKKNESTAMSGMPAKKTMIIGDTTFNPENAEPDVNPHNDYAGWATIRYGIGETLFKLSDEMELTPWLATEWKNVDEYTWEITLREGVKFSSGREMDAAAVKQCLEHLTKTHDRAPNDLMLDEIMADGQVLTLKTKVPRPALLNYLCDPYGCIIDVDAGFDGGIVAGTGPYIAVDCESGDHLNLVKNESYWGGMPHIDELTIRTISDGNTLSAALQSGDIDAAYGMAYEAYPLFRNDNYQFSQIATSRAFICWMNYESPFASDPAVRKAIAMGIDKEGFVSTLLDGNGEVAKGVFPDSFSFGGSNLTTESYDPDGARSVLEAAGWIDSDGDGIRENKDGSKLTINFAARTRDAANESLIQQYLIWWKEIGLDVQLYTGRTIESNNFYVKIQADDPEIDMFSGGWGTGYDPNPSNLFGETAKFNFARYVNEKGTEIMKKISSTDAFDDAKNKEFYKEWQAYAKDEAFMIPTLVGDSVTAVNKRVKYYDTSIATSGSKTQVYQIELTSETGTK